MSRKNHQVVNCRLLQTDKPFSQLTQTQKEKINEWLYQEYRAVYQKVGKVPDARHNDSIVLTAYRKIEEAGIWIPMGEVEKYFFSRKNAFRKRYEKELARTELLAKAKEVYPHS